jgi:lantibiotic modifying enzyme
MRTFLALAAAVVLAAGLAYFLVGGDFVARWFRKPAPPQEEADAAAENTSGRKNEPGPYLQAALETARWLRSTAVPAKRGRAWPAHPPDIKTVNTGLYSGVAGVVLFFLEAHRATQEKAHLDDARAGAEYLLDSLEGEKQPGLYVGLAGIGFALQEMFKATNDPRFRAGARRCLALLTARARKAGKGVAWNETTDVIAGSAGIGLFLLYAARELDDPSARELAARAGERLVEQARPAASGLKWAMSPGFNRLMPNFSHGTAGVAYFLASLYQETKHKPFLDAALAGAKYLQAVAHAEGGTCLVFHHEPGGEKLFYLGWCHGPAGTARLFYRLYQATGDRVWLGWVERCARSLLQSGIPEKQTPGFWNNVSRCCGSAGVAEFCLDVHRLTGDRQYLVFARHLTDDLLRRALSDENGMRWRGAEHRVKPELVTVQAGCMQGAAGVGLWLLYLNGFEHGRRGRITFPDSPF